jgi:hypothetical protein
MDSKGPDLCKMYVTTAGRSYLNKILRCERKGQAGLLVEYVEVGHVGAVLGYLLDVARHRVMAHAVQPERGHLRHLHHAKAASPSSFTSSSFSSYPSESLIHPPPALIRNLTSSALQEVHRQLGPPPQGCLRVV